MRKDMDTILLKGMIFYGYHGADKEENVLGQRFEVDVKMELNLAKAGETDALEDSVNYADVFACVKMIVEGKPCRLLERVAALINEKIMETYPAVQEVTTSVHKPGAPIPGVLGDVVVTLKKKR